MCPGTVKLGFDPVQNIRGGLAYLRWLLAYFKGDVALVAAAYNAGEGAVDRHRGIPPYAETRAYVKRILQLFREDAHPYDAKVTTPSPELPRMRKVEVRSWIDASLAPKLRIVSALELASRARHPTALLDEQPCM